MVLKLKTSKSGIVLRGTGLPAMHFTNLEPQVFQVIILDILINSQRIFDF